MPSSLQQRDNHNSNNGGRTIQSRRNPQLQPNYQLLLLILFTAASNAFVPLHHQQQRRLFHPMTTTTTTTTIMTQKRQNTNKHNPSNTHQSLLLYSSNDAADDGKSHTSAAATTEDTTPAASIPLSMQDAKEKEEEKDDSRKLQNEPTTTEATSTAILEAKALREKARLLREEANEAETALKKVTLEKIDLRNAELDDYISQLFVVEEEEETPEDLERALFNYDYSALEEKQKVRMEHVTETLRSLCLSTEKLVHLVERVFEREMQLSVDTLSSSSSSSSTATAAMEDGGDGVVSGRGSNEAATFMIGDVTNVASTRYRTRQRLSHLLDDIVNATIVLDEEKSLAAMGNNTGSSISSSSSSENIKAVKLQTPAIRARVKELRKAADADLNRRLTYRFSTTAKKNGQQDLYRGEDENIEELISRTMSENGDYYYNSDSISSNNNNNEDNSNLTEYLRNVVDVPFWVPLQLLPFVVTAKPEEELSIEEWKTLKREVFQGSRFFVTGWDSMRLAAVYRGNFMRVAPASTALPNTIEKNIVDSTKKKEEMTTATTTTDKQDGKTNNNSSKQRLIPTSEIIFSDLQSRLEQSSLKGKVQLFFMEDYEENEMDGVRTGSSTSANPVVIALPKSIEPLQASERGNGAKVLSTVSVVLALLTTFAYSVSSYALNPTFFNSVINENDISALSTCIPLALGVIVLHAAHEVAHIIAARARKIKIGLPVPLPSLQIGTFGCITPLRSFPESRSALLDVALAGPAVTMTLSIILMVAGVLLTTNASAEALVTMPVVPVALLKSSFVVGSIISAMAPKIMMLPLSQPVPIHPLFMVGLTGLISSALNMLPIGRLDGGRACMATFGRRTAIFASFILLVVLLLTGLTGTSTVSIFWGLLVVLFQRNGDIAVRDEVTEVDSFRMSTYLTFMALTALILAPFPGGPGPL